MMRGWRVERTEQGLTISDDNRQFPAVFVERREDIPAEDRTFRRPSLGRANLLIVHLSVSRETLLIGNRGQYCHVTLEDISLMPPDAQWIWPVLRRQLDVRSARASLAALRLAASLAAEAIHMGRTEYFSSRRGALDQLVSLLEADDCERFVSSMPTKSSRNQGFHMQMRVRGLTKDLPVEPELGLRIEDEGPTVVIDW
jgi:hypothetical protein